MFFKILLYLFLFVKCFKFDFESICRELNQNGSHCSFSCSPLDTNDRIINYTSIKITLNDLDALPEKSLSNLSIYSLTIIDPDFTLEMMNKLSDIEYIDQFYLEKLENLTSLFKINEINNQNMLFQSKKIKTFIIKDIVNVDETSVIRLLKTLDKLGVVEFRLTNIRIDRLKIDLTNYNNFLKLVFIWNQIDYFEIILGNNTRQLSISKCHMQQFKLTKSNNFSCLEKIELIENNLKSIDLPELNNLIELDLFLNSFQFIKNDNFNNVKSLKSLGINQNLLVSIEKESFKPLKTLEYLNLDSNFLNESLTLSNLDSVQDLSLRSNKFRSFSSNKNLNNPANLKKLDLSFNLVETIFIQIPTLVQILLENNKLKIIDSISGTQIVLNSNLIILSKINFEKLNLIQSVDLVSTSITSMTKEEILRLENVTSINLANNFIQHIEFPFMKYLNILFLSNNKIRQINATTFSNLNILNS